MKLPKDRNLWKVPAFKIKKSLNRLGYDDISSFSSIITFERTAQNRFPKLQKIIEKRYKESYPTLKIDRISVKPTGSRADSFDFKSECNVRLTEKSLRKSSGTFVVHCKKRRYYFHYTLDGRILVYKANHQIKKDKIIDLNKVHAEYIRFDRFYAPPITEPGTGKYIARQNIGAQKVLTAANVEPMPAVLKNSKVNCFYKEGSVVIEFEAIALRNGRIGDIIPIKKSDGKILRGTVMKNGRVEIR